MNKRFLEKNKYLSFQNPHKTLERLKADVDPNRYNDFVNYIANKLTNSENKELDIDYSFFGADNQEKIQLVNKLKQSEFDFLSKVDFEDINLKSSNILDAAAFLTKEFENSFFEKGEPSHDGVKLKNFLQRSEDKSGESKYELSDFLIEEDLTYLNTIALLSKKKAFFKTSKSLEEDSSGSVIKYRPVTSIADVVSIDLLSHVEPNFLKKLACEEYYKKTRFNKINKSQNLIILVDDSGSMSSDNKPSMLKAAINLKLRNCNDSTNIYIGTFERKVFGFQKVTNKNNFSDLTKIELDGGGTNVCGCIKHTISMIKKRKLLKYSQEYYDLSEDHFEILVINDGEDHIDTSYHPDIKIHTVTLLEENEHLRNLCIKSGGTYLNIK